MRLAWPSEAPLPIAGQLQACFASQSLFRVSGVGQNTADPRAHAKKHIQPKHSIREANRRVAARNPLRHLKLSEDPEARPFLSRLQALSDD